MTKYFVDSTGKYLGGFDGYRPPDKAIMGSRPKPDKPEETEPVVLRFEPQPDVMPDIPPGAVEVPGPPGHGSDRWDGTWVPDLAARRNAVSTTIEHVLTALAAKGIVITQADLDAVKAG